MTNRFQALMMTTAATLATAAAVTYPALTSASASDRHAHSAASRTQTLRIYDTPVKLTVTDPHGRQVKNPTAQPGPGDILDVYSLDYTGNHAHHNAHWTMSTHTRCVFAGKGEPACESDVAVGGSLLVFRGNTLAGATGTYQGATGRVISNKTIGNSNNSDIVARITRP